MVATPEQVDNVLFGEDPAASSLDPGAVVMIMAIVGPAAVQRWVEWLGHQHVEVVDAPVSGGVRRAAEGDLLIMVGGANSAVRRVQPVLDAMAGQAPVLGPVPGDGQKVKLVNCYAECTSRQRLRPSPTPRPWALTRPQRGRSSAGAPPRPSCWTTAVSVWCNRRTRS
jgi:3-hydroxyisobutyrate dehydrogenase-like beta-hydroxyacid dehydrogenase